MGAADRLGHRAVTISGAGAELNPNGGAAGLGRDASSNS